MNVRNQPITAPCMGCWISSWGGLPQMELYFEIGRAVCCPPGKGAAVIAAEYLQANYLGDRGFSPAKPAADAGILPGLCG